MDCITDIAQIPQERGYAIRAVFDTDCVADKLMTRAMAQHLPAPLIYDDMHATPSSDAGHARLVARIACNNTSRPVWCRERPPSSMPVESERRGTPSGNDHDAGAHVHAEPEVSTAPPDEAGVESRGGVILPDRSHGHLRCCAHEPGRLREADGPSRLGRLEQLAHTSSGRDPYAWDWSPKVPPRHTVRALWFRGFWLTEAWRATPVWWLARLCYTAGKL